MSYLIITGSFACGMAFHNTTARYMYSLGREKLLPPALGRTHKRWHSPHIASVTQLRLLAGPDRSRRRAGRHRFAFYLKRRDPARYERAGRLVNEGL
jgi:hypothetical protein